VNERTDNPLVSHVGECDECRPSPPSVAALAARLDASAVQIDAARLSRLALARVRPALRVRAEAAFWRRFIRALAAALLPLPLLVAADWWLLGRLYDVVAAWLPSAVATYFVLSYAASLVVLIGSVYAAIPLLLAHHIPEPDGAPA
jgi:hypothetical protein